MRKLVSVIVIITLILLMTCSISFAQDLTLNDEPIDINGISMTADDFKETLSGKPETRKALQSTRSLSNATISIDNVTINGEDINFLANMWINGQVVSLPITGQLCAGYKSQHDFNSIIINVTEPVKGYEILLFEIFNDTTDNEQLVNSLTGQIETQTPYVKIYIQDQNNTIYLFESEMPECFSKLAAEDYPSAPKQKDALWARELVNYECSKIPATNGFLEELGLSSQLRAVDTYTTWHPDTINRYSFYVGADYTVCYSLPCFKYLHANVDNGNSTWFAEFYVSEHMRSAGYVYYGTNVFDYRDLCIVYIRGDNTKLVRSFQEGIVYHYNAFYNNLKTEGAELIINVLKNGVGKLTGGETIADVAEFVYAMTTTQETIELGSEMVDLFPSMARGGGVKLTNYSFEECSYHGLDEVYNEPIGHHFIFQLDVTHIFENNNVDLLGGFFLEFDTYFEADGSRTPVKMYFPLENTIE